MLVSEIVEEIVKVVVGIFLVDDEEAIREVTKAILENYNYQSITAKNGMEAITIYAQYQDQIKVVLMDMMMPEMDGNTVIRTLKTINPQFILMYFL